MTLAYAATSVAFLYAIPLDAMRTGDAFAAQLGELLFGRSGGVALAAIVIVSVLGTLSAFMMVTPRLYVAMARDGLFPAAAAAIHPRFGTPSRAIAVQATLASLLVLLGTFQTIVAYFVFITVVFIGLHRGVGVRAAAPPCWPARRFRSRRGLACARLSGHTGGVSRVRRRAAGTAADEQPA